MMSSKGFLFNRAAAAALTDVQILRIEIELTSGQSITFSADVGRPSNAIVVLICTERG